MGLDAISNHDSVTESDLCLSNKETRATPTSSITLSSVSSVQSPSSAGLSKKEKVNIHHIGNQESDNNGSRRESIPRNISDQHNVKEEHIVTTPAPPSTGDAKKLFNNLTLKNIHRGDLNTEGRARKTYISLLGIFVNYDYINSRGCTSEKINRIIDEIAVNFSKYTGMSEELKALLVTCGQAALNKFIEDFNQACDTEWLAKHPGVELTDPQADQYKVNKEFCNIHAKYLIKRLTDKNLAQAEIQTLFILFRDVFLAQASSVDSGYIPAKYLEQPFKNPVSEVKNDDQNGLNVESAKSPHLVQTVAEIHAPPVSNKANSISSEVIERDSISDTTVRRRAKEIAIDMIALDDEAEATPSENTNHKLLELPMDESQNTPEIYTIHSHEAKRIKNRENDALELIREPVRQFGVSGNPHQFEFKSSVNSGNNPQVSTEMPGQRQR